MEGSESAHLIHFDQASILPLIFWCFLLVNRACDPIIRSESSRNILHEIGRSLAALLVFTALGLASLLPYTPIRYRSPSHTTAYTPLDTTPSYDPLQETTPG